LAKVGKAIIAASLIVVCGVRPLATFGDESAVEEHLEQAVERAGTKPHAPLRESLDFLHNGVPMEIAAGQRQQDVKIPGGERQE
jgi:hypothetical protein